MLELFGRGVEDVVRLCSTVCYRCVGRKIIGVWGEGEVVGRCVVRLVALECTSGISVEL